MQRPRRCGGRCLRPRCVRARGGGAGGRSEVLDACFASIRSSRPRSSSASSSAGLPSRSCASADCGSIAGSVGFTQRSSARRKVKLTKRWRKKRTHASTLWRALPFRVCRLSSNLHALPHGGAKECAAAAVVAVPSLPPLPARSPAPRDSLDRHAVQARDARGGAVREPGSRCVPAKRPVKGSVLLGDLFPWALAPNGLRLRWCLTSAASLLPQASPRRR